MLGTEHQFIAGVFQLLSYVFSIQALVNIIFLLFLEHLVLFHAAWLNRKLVPHLRFPYRGGYNTHGATVRTG
jgi:hypothetical protein